MNKLIALVNQLQKHIPEFERSNSKYSTVAVGWQIEHSLITIDRIVAALQKSNPEDYQRQFNFSKFRVFLLKEIPRGKAQAPKVVIPATDFNEITLTNHITKTLQTIESLASIQPNHFFKHPYLGYLKLKDTITFLEIHTQHHLSIIEDVLKEE